MLTYESATELLHLNLEEESELKMLSEAAALRLKWRRQQVGGLCSSIILIAECLVLFCLYNSNPAYLVFIYLIIP